MIDSRFHQQADRCEAVTSAPRPAPQNRPAAENCGEAGRKQKLKVDNEEENTFSYVNNKDMAAGAGHADAGAGLGSQIPQDR